MTVAHVKAKMLGLVAVTLGAVVIAAFYYSAAGGTLPLSGEKYTVTATVREPQQLLKHADVRAGGVKVGKVSELTPVGSGAAKVEFQLDNEDLVPLYRDATVLVRQKTLVGENYLEVVRGNRKAGDLPDGANLPVSRDRESVPLDRILNSLDARTRAHVSRNLRSLGAGFDGRGGDFNRLLAALRPTVSDGSRVVGILEAQREEVADIVEQAGTVFDAVSQRRADMHTLVRSAKTTAEAVAARDAELRAAFSELPGALSQARKSVAKLSAFSNHATPVVGDLRTGLVELKPVFRDLEPTAVEGRRLFAKLPALVKAADPVLTRLRGFSQVAAPAFPALDGLLRQANPALDYLKPYYKDIGSLLSNFGAGAQNDAWGGTGRCACPVSDYSFSNWTPAERAAVAVLLDQGIVAEVQNPEANPLRGPGGLPGNGGSKWSGKYPRITAEP